jgi:2-oxoglutarate ferredoxin oxidoreductase subunit beta
MCEILNQLDAPAYIARVTCADVPNAKKAKAAVKKAFEYQMAGKGFSFVEFVSNCPTNWGMTPLESLDYIHDTIIKEFPLGEFRAK